RHAAGLHAAEFTTGAWLRTAEPSVRAQFLCTTISTRRFFALSLSVAFGAIGRYSPWPTTRHWPSGTLHSTTRNVCTACARAIDSSRFDPNFDFLIGSASVWPSIEYFAPSYFDFSVDATERSAFSPSFDRLASPDL